MSDDYKFNSRIPRYNDDSNYTTNAPSYYDDLARKNKLLEKLAHRIWEYQELINTQFSDWDNEITQRFLDWDKNLEEFDDEVIRLLLEWLEDGTLDQIINENIFNMKAEQSDLNITDNKVANLEITKADKDEVFSMANMGQDVKEAMTGGSVAVIGDNTVLKDNIVNNQVDADKVDFFEYGNVFDGHYQRGYLQISFKTDRPYSRIAILELEPNKQYRILKEDSERFVVGLTNFMADPDDGRTVTLIKNDWETPTPYPPDSNFSYWDFNTDSENIFLYVFVSIELAEEPVMYIQDKSLLSDSKIETTNLLTSKNIVKGKNLCDGSYLNADIRDTSEVGNTVPLTFQPQNGSVYVIKVKRNTTYTISKTHSNIFRVGVSHGSPEEGRMIKVLKGVENDDNSVTTITTEYDTRYLYLYLSWTTPAPTFVQVEEGGVQTDWETYGYKLTPKAQPFDEYITQPGDGEVEQPVDEEIAKSAFIDEMNKKAQQIGMSNTVYLDSSGLTVSGQNTTASDLIKLGVQAMGYNKLVEVWNKKTYTMNVRGPNARSETIETSVTGASLEDHYHIFGGKTGSGGNYRNLLVVVDAPDGNMFVGSILGSVPEDRYIVAKELFDIGKLYMQDGYTGTHDVQSEKAAVALLPKHNTIAYEGYDIPILWSKDDTTQFWPASTTKVMTAIVMLNYIEDWNETLTIKGSDITTIGSGPTMQHGDVISFKDALYGMMLPSSNTLAVAVSRAIGERIVRSKQ